MELKEIIKILKNNLAIIFSCIVIGGVIAAVIVSSRPAEYRGDFQIYLNAIPSEKSLQNYNEFYALESLGQVSDLFAEWSRGRSFESRGIVVQLKKKTAIYLEGVLSAESEAEIREDFDGVISVMVAKINELNGGIFANNKIAISFSGLDIEEMKTNLGRYLGAGVFAGLVVGIFAVFAKYYLKEEK